MSAPKNYTVRGILTKEDESEIEAVLAKFPLWKRKHARELVARRKFARSIGAKGGAQ